ncbi:hypothetical protein [Vitreoscilla stercoraria]|uniref:hypothetical protein n=1 Tax=Vitreoscilla stercoraria TaxID=61 RepID=UPI00035F29BC|nr:hypothetical protein [Vitreoscilla stercoraria]AUZ04997.1 hypothetical protein ADP71_13830 [Vitreoscilla sp. C1]
MSERDIFITVVVILSALSILTTPFMLMNRGKIKNAKMPKSPLQNALIWASNLALIVLLAWLAYYFGLFTF